MPEFPSQFGGIAAAFIPSLSKEMIKWLGMTRIGSPRMFRKASRLDIPGDGHAMQVQLSDDGAIRLAFTVKFDHLLVAFQPAGSTFQPRRHGLTRRNRKHDARRRPPLPDRRHAGSNSTPPGDSGATVRSLINPSAARCNLSKNARSGEWTSAGSCAPTAPGVLEINGPSR